MNESTITIVLGALLLVFYGLYRRALRNNQALKTDLIKANNSLETSNIERERADLDGRLTSAEAQRIEDANNYRAEYRRINPGAMPDRMWRPVDDDDHGPVKPY